MPAAQVESIYVSSLQAHRAWHERASFSSAPLRSFGRSSAVLMLAVRRVLVFGCKVQDLGGPHGRLASRC